MTINFYAEEVRGILELDMEMERHIYLLRSISLWKLTKLLLSTILRSRIVMQQL